MDSKSSWNSTAIYRALTLFGLVACFGSTNLAAVLRTETLDAWSAYLQTIKTRERSECCSGMHQSHALTATVLDSLKEGQISVEPASQVNPTRVPFGLIHNWNGAVFIPAATLDQVLTVVLAYDRYTEFYSPLIVESKTLTRSSDRAEFSLVMQNRSLFSRAAVLTRYLEQVLRPNSCLAESETHSVSMQEVENYGSSKQRVLPPEEAIGYLWRIYSLARYEQSTDGVLLQLQIIVLSRDVPKGLRWFVDPIVRRVAETTVRNSLERTRAAIVRNTSAQKKASTGSVLSSQKLWRVPTFR